MACLPVRGDNPRALASGLSYIQVDKHVATLGRLRDILLILNNCLKSGPKSDPNWKTEQILYTFLRLLKLHRMSIQLFSLLNRR